MDGPDERSILFGKANADFVLVQLDEHPQPDGWRSGSVTVHAGCWSGCGRVSFFAGELEKFADEMDQLYRNLSGQAKLQPLEPYLELTLIGNGRGQIRVEGRAGEVFDEPTYLSFKLDLDQTELPLIVRALRAATGLA